MSNVKFNLKDKNTEKSLIHLIMYYEKHRLKMSTGLSIETKYWNEAKQRAREIRGYDDFEFINSRLDKLSAKMNLLFNEMTKDGVFPHPSELKQAFIKLKDNPIKKSYRKSLWEYFEDFIDDKRKQVSDVRDYHNSLRKHLLAVEEKIGYPLAFAHLKENGEFKEYWSDYLTGEAINSKGEYGLSINTVGKQNKNLKVFLNWCFDKEICTRFSIKHFVTESEDIDSVYLTEEELLRLEKLTLSDKDSIVRDLFLIGCETALRFSDFIRLNTKYIRDNKLYFQPKKTRNSGARPVVIPVSKRFQNIIDKYDGKLPSYSDKMVTDFNKTLREICLKANINDDIIIYRTKAGKNIEESKSKYELVSSHTARRTFCTLKYLKGLDTHIIMKFSGHKSERSFMKYLRIDAEVAAEKYADFF